MARFPRATPADALIAAMLIGACALIAALIPSAGDYSGEMAPAMRALLRADLGGFGAVAPVYGASAWPRLPFAAGADALGGGDLAVYRAGAFACMIAAAGLAWWLQRALRTQGRPLLERVVVVALILLAPVVLRTLRDGHPEDVLAAALAVGAALAAARGAVLPAGLALGFAVTAKPWAVLAVAPVLLAAPGRHALLLAAAGLAAGVSYLPILLLTTQAQTGATHVAALTTTGRLFHPQQLLWPLREAHDLGAGAVAYSAPSWVSRVAHPAIVLAGVMLAALWAGRRRATAAHADDALLLLAACLFLRALLDPWNLAYYAVPAILALTVWEGLRRRGLPVLALGVTAMTWLSFVQFPRYLGWDGLAAAYLGWALPVCVLLITRLLAPDTLASLGRRRAEVFQPSSSATAARTSRSAT